MVNLRYKKSVFVLMLSLIAVISSCELFTDKKVHEHTTQYTCPMHPEIIRDEFGSCPICKMDLVPKITKAEQVKDPGAGVAGARVLAAYRRSRHSHGGRSAGWPAGSASHLHLPGGARSPHQLRQAR